MKQNIKRFQIKNLFNYMDVDLPLNQNVNIFLGENGLGKTTILNLLYNTMTCRFEKLRDTNFESIKIIFSDNEEYEIDYDDVIEYSNYLVENHYNRYQRMDFIFTEKEIDEIRNSIIHDSFNKNMQDYVYRVSDVFRIPIRMAERELRRYVNLTIHESVNGNFENIESLKKKLENKFTDEIMYFPTYRRIEEDLSKLDIDVERESDKIKTKLIHFGMKDVDSLIAETLDSIRNLAIDSFTEMTGILLTQYIDSENIFQDKNKYRNIDIEKLAIVLDRVGDKIKIKDKNNIKTMVQNGSIYNNIYLLNLLNNLIISYEKQKKYDEKIKKFVAVCNKYLVKKNFKYDESNLKLDLINDRNGEIISIEKLSSGEKQLISIFSKLYLEDSESCIILFDEPELSLSIEWQSNLLPDIMKSGKCKKLIAVTHSPFIFENEYDLIAKDMGKCLKYKTK